jgi:hypothetical protein
LIGDCSLNQNSINAPPNVSDGEARTKRKQQSDGPQAARKRAAVQPPAVVHTPRAPSQRANFAALHTAASISGRSGISTLTQSIQAQPSHRRVTTRATVLSSEEKDSDDDDTVEEDEYVVDFTQNFWESRRQLQEMVREDVFDDDMLGSEGDVSTCPPNCEINDYAELLKNCTEFDFQLVTPGQARIVDQAQKIYDGESH